MLSLLGVYLGLALLAPLLRAVEHRPADAAREAKLDLAYWLITPLVTGTVSRAASLGLLGIAALLVGQQPVDGMAIWSAPARVLRSWPLAAQATLALVLGDLIGYWSHRLRHRFAWRLHRIHHGAEALTALSAARMHPLDELIDTLAITPALFLLGFDWTALAIVGPATLLYTLVTHASVDWSYGKLGYIFVSPRFHRVHHLRDYGGRDGKSVNFAGVLAIWDLLFGSADFATRLDATSRFGVKGGVPPTLLGQLTDPLTGPSQ